MNLVTVRNGIVTENMTPEEEIYEWYTIIKINAQGPFGPWAILVKNKEYFPLLLGRIPGGRIINRVQLSLTTADKAELEVVRDLTLANI